MIIALLVSASSAMAENDPVAMFQDIVNRMPTVVDLSNHHVVTNVRFDVRKTESLVAPITGVIDFTVVASSPMYPGTYMTFKNGCNSTSSMGDGFSPRSSKMAQTLLTGRAT